MDTAMLRTALYEVMSTLNSRPITAVCDGDSEEPVITRNHLLTQKVTQVPPPPGEITDNDTYSRERWRRVQIFAQEFWQIWKATYLSNIMKRQKWNTPQENLAEGDLVLLTDDSSRNQWKMGIVEHVHPGKDGLVRNVTIRMGNRNLDSKGVPFAESTVVKRPVQKHILLQRKSAT